MFNDSGYTTPCSMTAGSTRFSSRHNEAVNHEYDLPVDILGSYFEKDKHQNSDFFNYYKEYQNDKLEVSGKRVFSDLLQYFSDNRKLVGNKVLYEAIIRFLEYATVHNFLHKKRREDYEQFLKKALFQDNANSIDTSCMHNDDELDYSKFESNNFRQTYKNEAINNIHARGGVIFLNSDAKICCKFSKNSNLKEYSKKQAEMILSAELMFNIKITEDVTDYVDMNTSIVCFSEIIEKD